MIERGLQEIFARPTYMGFLNSRADMFHQFQPQLHARLEQVADIYKEDRYRYRPHEVQEFVYDALIRLAYAGSLLSQEGIIKDTAPYQESLLRWAEDEVHGPKHSYYVFEGAKLIRDKEGYQIDDIELWVRPVLHDFGEFIPWYDLKTGLEIPLSTDPSVLDKLQKIREMLHPQIMKRAITLIGEQLGVKNTHTLARDILYHDIYYHSPSLKMMEEIAEKLSDAGKCLADADHALGSSKISLYPNSNDLDWIEGQFGPSEVEEQLKRNRAFSLGKWYFLRPELNASERLSWRRRTGGLYDGLCAIWREFNGLDHWYFTNTGKVLNNLRKSIFRRELFNYYGFQLVNSKLSLNTAQKFRGKVFFGLKNKDGGILPIPEDQLPRLFRRMTLQQQMRAVMKIPVLHLSKSEQKYYGYSVAIEDTNGTLQWIDPSIASFESRQQLEKALSKSLDEMDRLVY